LRKKADIRRGNGQRIRYSTKMPLIRAVFLQIAECMSDNQEIAAKTAK